MKKKIKRIEDLNLSVRDKRKKYIPIYFPFKEETREEKIKTCQVDWNKLIA